MPPPCRSPSRSLPHTTILSWTGGARSSIGRRRLSSCRRGRRRTIICGLLGVLNSSTACFWLKQVSHDKGIRGEGGGFMQRRLGAILRVHGTKFAGVSVAGGVSARIGARWMRLAQRLHTVSPAGGRVIRRAHRGAAALAEASGASTRARMIALQEELDWQVYRSMGAGRRPDRPGRRVPELDAGRAGVRDRARPEDRAARTETHGSPATARRRSRASDELVGRVPGGRGAADRADRGQSQHRVDRAAGVQAAVGHRGLGRDAGQQALRDWLLDRCESRALWYAQDETG